MLFSGDCYNPSLMSTITLGKQMVPVLNEIGVNVSCVGVSDGAQTRRAHGSGELPFHGLPCVFIEDSTWLIPCNAWRVPGLEYGRPMHAGLVRRQLR